MRRPGIALSCRLRHRAQREQTQLELRVCRSEFCCWATSAPNHCWDSGTSPKQPALLFTESTKDSRLSHSLSMRNQSFVKYEPHETHRRSLVNVYFNYSVHWQAVVRDEVLNPSFLSLSDLVSTHGFVGYLLFPVLISSPSLTPILRVTNMFS